MSKYTSHLYQFGSAILFSLVFCSIAQAGRMVQAVPDSAGIRFATSASNGGASISITGPEGYVLQRRGASVADLALSGLADGQYNYEVTLEPVVKRGPRDGDEMSMQPRSTPTSISSGSFTVTGGAIVDPNIQE